MFLKHAVRNFVFVILKLRKGNFTRKWLPAFGILFWKNSKRKS